MAVGGIPGSAEAASSSTTRLVLASLSAAFVLFALAPGKPGLPPSFKADEPAYYLMALSLARDGDLRCETQDLARLWEEYPRQQVDNLILASDDGWHTVYFGKPFAYSLLAAPFVAAFGANGMVALNMLLLWLMVWLGTRYLRRTNPEPVAALFSVGFFLVSTAFSYVFWLHPEVFMMASVAVCLALGGFGESGADSEGWRSGLTAAASGAVLALGAYHKPMLVALGLPLLFGWWRRRRLRPAVAWCGGMVAGLALLAATAVLFTGHPSAYLGMARTGVRVDAADAMPVQPRDVPAAAAAPKANSWIWLLRVPKVDWPELFEDLGYFLWGRHTGLIPYLPFAALAVLLFLLHDRRRADKWVLLASLAGVALFFLIWIPFNWHGGGGFIGNRYFVVVYPAFLFLVGPLRPRWLLPATYGLGGFLLGGLLFTPFGAPVPHPTLQAHVRNLPFRLFPLELSLAGQIPGYRAGKVGDLWFRGRTDEFLPHGDQLWCQGGSEVEVWMSALLPPPQLVFQVRSPVARNLVTIRGGGARTEAAFVPGGASSLQVVLGPLEPDRVLSRDGVEVYYYRLLVAARRGTSVPVSELRPDRTFQLGASLVPLGDVERVQADLYGASWKAVRLPAEMIAGEVVRVPVEVVNTSHAPWPAEGGARVRLSYRWLDAEGEEVIVNGLRTDLPADVPAEGETVLQMEVEAPPRPGRYILALEPLYERVSWFSAHDPGAVYRTPVEVVPPPGAGGPTG